MVLPHPASTIALSWDIRTKAQMTNVPKFQGCHRILRKIAMKTKIMRAARKAKIARARHQSGVP